MTGRSVFFIPGQFSDGSQAGAAGGLGLPLATVTLPGYGGVSVNGGRFDLDAILQVVEGAAPPGKSVLIGNSAGAQWAVMFAAKRPERIERAVLLNPGGFWDIPEPAVEAVMRDFTPERLASWDDAKLERDFGALFKNMDAKAAFLARLAQKRFSPEAASGYIRASFETSLFGPLESLKAAGIPVDVVLGAEDPLLDLQAIRKAVSERPWIGLREITECGHMPQLDRPAETSRALKELILN